MPNESGEGQLPQVSPQKASSFELVGAIVKLLESLPREEQKHVLHVVMTWLYPEELSKFNPLRASAATPEAPQPIAKKTSPGEYAFAERVEISPKEFLLEKDPKTDVERLACLGYYLTHYRDLPQFKTEDLSKLNTDAAQRKFANAAFTAKNAVRDGFLVQGSKKGFRQISAVGEQYVQALPDHEAARAVRKRMRGHGRRLRSRDETGDEMPDGPADESSTASST